MSLHSSIDSLVLRVAAGVDDPIHVQIEVVKLNIIGVRLSRIHWYLDIYML